MLNLNSILVVNSSYTNSYRLKDRLIKEQLKQNLCEICKLTTWLNRPIPLDLHHINGDHTDNRLNNLQILCANCHRLTSNYGSKNRGSFTRSEKYDIIKIENALLVSKNWKQLLENLNLNYNGSGGYKNIKKHAIPIIKKLGIEFPVKRKLKFCINCNKQIHAQSTRCSVCSKIENRKVKNIPTKKELQVLLKNNTWVSIGKLYGVSDNAVRKWAKKYKLI